MKLNRIYSTLLFCCLNTFVFGQTDPTAQSLPYTQDFSALASTSTTYPAGWQGWQLATAPIATYRTTAPTADVNLTASGNASINTGAIYNYNGKIGFLQSGTIDPALCLAISTTGLNGISVTYDVMTIRNPNARINEVSIQYRVGTSGAFTSLTSAAYQNNTTVQTTAVTTPQNSVTKTVTLPATCDNQTVVELRWTARDASGSGARPSFAFDNINITSCSTNTSTYYYRSFTTGNWNTASTWEASPTGVGGWITACTPPTSAAASVVIQSGHTVTIDANATAPDVTVNFGGTLQSNNTAYVNLTLSGNLVNNGTLQMVNGSFATNVIFNKNGNQSITGTGGTTNFYSIGLNMGTSSSNILDISPSVFTSSAKLLVNNSGTYTLLNGTLKFSGSFLYSNKLFNLAGPTIPATAGIWLNNSTVTILGAAYSYVLYGSIKITAGTFNIGTASGNSLKYRTGSSITISGGALKISGRLSGDLVTSSTSYTQSGGTVTLMTVGSASISQGAFDLRDLASSFTMSGGTMIMDNGSDFYGSFDYYNFAGSYSVTGGTVQFCDNAVAASIIDYYINTNVPIYNLLVTPTNGSSIWLYNDLTVLNNLTISSTNNFDVKTDPLSASAMYPAYPLVPIDYNMTVGGNFTNSGTFYSRSNTVTFNGSAAQNIIGTSSTTFNNLTINNSSGGVTLQIPTQVNSALTLTNGYVYTDATNLLTLNSASTTSGASNSSFVYGPMAKIGSTDFTFPVGKDLEYRPISATALTGPETFTAEYFHTDPNPSYNRLLKDPTLDHLDGCEYWILNRAGTVDAFVTLSWDTYSCGVTSLPDLAVARWDGTMWKDHGNGATTGTTSIGTVMSSAIVTSFSPFTLSSTVAGVNPLPVELVAFDANYNSNGQVNLKWTTASETNNDFFTIERSADGIQFENLFVKDGAGNSSSYLNYFGTDDSPLLGVSYYRLKQTDFNGAFKYSRVVAVEKSQSDFEIVQTNYSENNQEMEIYFNCDSKCMVDVDVYDLAGKKIYSSKENVLGTHSEIKFSTSQFSKGIYLLNISNGEKILSRKINF